jgi:hypothetical protein
MRLVRGGDPAGVWVQEEEEDHAECHEIHVDEEEDAAVVEAPTSLHASDCVRGAGHGEEGGEDEEQGGVVVWEVGEADGSGQAGQDENIAAYKRTFARIENAGQHAILIDLTDSMLLLLSGCGRVGCGCRRH